MIVRPSGLQMAETPLILATLYPPGSSALRISESTEPTQVIRRTNTTAAPPKIQRFIASSTWEYRRVCPTVSRQASHRASLPAWPSLLGPHQSPALRSPE